MWVLFLVKLSLGMVFKTLPQTHSEGLLPA